MTQLDTVENDDFKELTYLRSVLSPSIILSLLIQFRDRPGYNSSWPVVVKAIKDFATQSKDVLPTKIYDAVWLVDRRKLYNFEKERTTPDDSALDLFRFFISSDFFLSYVPYAKTIVDEKNNFIADGKTLAKYLGHKSSRNVGLKEISGYWKSNPYYLGQSTGPDGNAQYAITSMTIENIKNEEFAIIHQCTQLFYGPITGELFREKEAYYEGSLGNLELYDLRDPLSGFIFNGQNGKSFRLILYSRFTNDLVVDTTVTVDDHAESKIFSLDSKVNLTDIVYINNLNDKFYGPCSLNDFSEFPFTNQLKILFEDIRWSVLSNEID